MSLDSQYTWDTLQDMLAAHPFAYPVVCQYAGTGEYGSFGWELERGIPTAFIIDPQGVVRAEVYPEIELIEVLEHFMAHPAPPYALSVELSQDESGAVFARLSASSPEHLPLKLRISATQLVPEAQEEGGEDQRSRYDNLPVDGLDGTVIPASFTETGVYGAFGDFTVELPVLCKPDAMGVRVRLAILLPGSEAFYGGNGLVIEATDFLRLGE